MISPIASFYHTTEIANEKTSGKIEEDLDFEVSKVLSLKLEFDCLMDHFLHLLRKPDGKEFFARKAYEKLISFVSNHPEFKNQLPEIDEFTFYLPAFNYYAKSDWSF